KLDHVRGSVFERRFAEIVVLDHLALIKRIAYAVTNPVQANLVRSHKDWTGLCLFGRADTGVHRFTTFHDGPYQRALESALATGAHVDRDDFLETAELEIAALDKGLADNIAAAIDAREADLRKAQTGV